MNNKNTRLLVAILGAVLIAAIAATPLMMAQNAQAQSRKLTCDTTKDCNIIIRRLRVGDDLIIQFKAAPPATGGGGGTTGPTEAIDQQARDDITQLKTSDAQQTNDIQRLQEGGQQIVTAGETLKGNVTELTNIVMQQNAAIQELQTIVKNITDSNPFVDLNVTQPGGGGGNESTGPGEQPTTPSENETGGAPGNGENQTTTPPVGGNESSTTPPTNTTLPTEPPVVSPPIVCGESEIFNNTMGQCVPIPPAGETPTEPTEQPGTNVTIPSEGNVTLPGGSNVTVPGEGNITLPGEGGNVSVPGESNVTLPIDNSTGDIIVTDNESAAIENATSGQDIIDFTGSP
jgi:hypothetical protein